MSYADPLPKPPAPPPPAPPAPEAPRFSLKAVTTCVNNADFLAHTAPLNRAWFDRFVIVTAPEDQATQKVCKTWKLECIVTDAFNSHWGDFRKGAGINRGLAKLDIQPHDWLLHLDADIILPGSFRHSIETAELDPRMIYGCDRIEFKSYQQFQKWFGNPTPLRDNMFIDMSHVDGATIGTRIAFDHHNGYIPIGFFQLWNAASGKLKYPEGHTNAGREDSLFSASWPRRQRAFLPEVVVYHLESEAADMGVNWKKRTTKPFSVDAPQNSRFSAK
jgi:hypothetical protein